MNNEADVEGTTTNTIIHPSLEDEYKNVQYPEKEEEEDTIYALSSGTTSFSATAVAVVRLSGPRAWNMLQQLLSQHSTDSQHATTTILEKKTIRPRMATVCKLYHPHTHDVLDQSLVLYFPGPRSFTGEDVIEIQCHGSRAVLQAIFDALSTLGARLAEPGEFTQRAFANGKLDVLQIEALADLLTSDTDQQRKQALRQLDGTLSQVYAEWRETLIAGLAHAEAVIDFGDDERLDDSVFGMDDDEYGSSNSAIQTQQDNIWGGVVTSMTDLVRSMRQQLRDQRRGELVREGVKIAIVGPPNAGKSSLFNLLAARDAAIVSPTAGTTRDVLEVSLNLGGIKCIVQDTAGVRSETQDVIEQEGIKRAVQAAKCADLVVAVVDSTDTDEGVSILENVLDIVTVKVVDDYYDDCGVGETLTLNPKNIVLVLNKADLHDNVDDTGEVATIASIQDRVGGCFRISCTTQDGIEGFLTDLTRRVGERVSVNDEDGIDDALHEGALITRARHRQHVQAAVEALDRFCMLSQQGSISVDMAAEELRLATSELGRITGAVDVEEVLDKLFADFCIGK
jgi:tRNA modification GTPase